MSWGRGERKGWARNARRVTLGGHRTARAGCESAENATGMTGSVQPSTAHLCGASHQLVGRPGQAWKPVGKFGDRGGDFLRVKFQAVHDGSQSGV